MATMVCFRASGAAYCVPVESTRSVRRATGMVALPDARMDVAGIIAGEPPLTVISPLGTGGGHILVMDAGGKSFGLLVDAVTGLVRVAAADIGAIPEGQSRPLVAGTIDSGGQLVMIADPVAMAGRL